MNDPPCCVVQETEEAEARQAGREAGDTERELSQQEEEEDSAIHDGYALPPGENCNRLIQNHMQHACSESAREQRIALYKNCE